MLEQIPVELPQNNSEPITRPKLKRLILEYLQARKRKDILDDIPCEENTNWND